MIYTIEVDLETGEITLLNKFAHIRELFYKPTGFELNLKTFGVYNSGTATNKQLRYVKITPKPKNKYHGQVMEKIHRLEKKKLINAYVEKI